ncbi:MAG: DUF4397 domain-containing protein [Ktedonobacteraceae bacterium]
MMRHSSKKFACFFLIGSVFALLALFSVRPTPVHAEAMAYIRVIHASPDVGIVDVFVDGNKLLSSFQFGVVTPYVPVPAGGHKIQIGLIGTGVDAAVITQSITVSASTPYTVAALGTKASGFSLSVFTDNNVVSTKDAKVRIYHLSPNATDVSISNGSNTIARGLTYQTASDYVNVPSGSYTFGAIIPASKALSLNANVQPWTVTSVFAIGVVNGTPAIQLISTQVAGVPGMPGTGSDPHAVSESTQPLSPWMFAMAFFLVIMACYATRHYMTRVHA